MIKSDRIQLKVGADPGFWSLSYQQCHPIYFLFFILFYFFLVPVAKCNTIIYIFHESLYSWHQKAILPYFSLHFLLQTRPWLTSHSDQLSYTTVFFQFFSFSHFPLSWGKANIFPFSPVCGYFKHSSYGYYEQVRLDCMVEMDQIGSKPTVVGAAPGFWSISYQPCSPLVVPRRFILPLFGGVILPSLGVNSPFFVVRSTLIYGALAIVFLW